MRRPRGFSLAELMIALAVLGIGLLVISAALPVGLRFTKETVDRDAGAAALSYAFTEIENALAIPLSTRDAGVLQRTSPIFVPRLNDAASTVDSSYSPLLKVRALHTQNVNATPGGPLGGWKPWEELPLSVGSPVFGEATAFEWLENVSGNGNLHLSPLEVNQKDANSNILPAFSAASLVYPPISSDRRWHPAAYLNDKYDELAGTWGPLTFAEAGKLTERNIGWTALYRRVSYASGSDPLLYEFIAVAARRPSAEHRFPVQNPAADLTADPPTSIHWPGGAGQPPVGTITPIPWMISFSDDTDSGVQPSVPLLTPGVDYDDTLPERPLKDGFKPPATLRFVVERPIGDLMPPGSIFIPAVNDAPTTNTPLLGATGGFVPALKDAAPVYKVLERNWNPDLGEGHYELTVENNGYYPWLPPGASAQYWPVWIIPPAFQDTQDVGGFIEPVLTEQSPVVAISRRYIRLHEIP